MTQRKGMPVLLRYALFQIPGVIFLGLGLMAACRWWDMSLPSALLIVLVWIAKDVVMFPILKRAYESSDSSRFDRLSGAEAVAQQSLNPSGYVSVGAELWRAELADESSPVDAGSAVRVVEVRGMTLLVEKLPVEGGF